MAERLCSRRFGFLLSALGGLLTGFTLIAPLALGWLEWITPALAVPLLWRYAEEKTIPKRYSGAWRGGFVFFFSYYLVVFHWFWALYPMSFAGISHWLAAVVVVIAWGGLSLFQGVGMAFCFVAIVFLWRMPFSARYRFVRPLIGAAVFTVAECLQTLAWFGVPWGRLSLGQAEYLPIVQTASLFGCYGITFLVIAVSFFGGQLLFSPAAGRRVLSAWACGLFLGNLAVGGALYGIGECRTPVNTATAGTVQGNFSTVSKWDMPISETVQLYCEYLEKLMEDGVELVLLPETAMPFLLQDYAKYREQLSEAARRGEMTLFTGAFTYDGDGTEYSSVMTFHADGTIDPRLYHKRHPVPFGEYVPMRKLIAVLIPPLADLNMWESDLGAGEEATVVEDTNGAYGFLICFDSIYESSARDSVRNGAQLLLLPTNDSWFLDSAALDMHHNQARLRAIECGRSVVRAANTGISSLITPTGRVTAILEPMTEGTVRGEVSFYSHVTPYVRWGNWFVWCCLGLVMLPVADKVAHCMRLRLDKAIGK